MNIGYTNLVSQRLAVQQAWGLLCGLKMRESDLRACRLQPTTRRAFYAPRLEGMKAGYFILYRSLPPGEG